MLCVVCCVLCVVCCVILLVGVVAEVHFPLTFVVEQPCLRTALPALPALLPATRLLNILCCVLFVVCCVLYTSTSTAVEEVTSSSFVAFGRSRTKQNERVTRERERR